MENKEKKNSVAIATKDWEKAKELATIHRVKMYELFGMMLDFFDKNREFLNPKNLLETEQGMTNILEKKWQKNLTKETNRLIGFIKKQDELLLDIQQEVRTSTKQILFKMIPREEQEFAEYNPLFDDYENVIAFLKKILNAKGVKSENIESEIQKELGEHFLKNYQESNQKIKLKNFLI